jgi:RHS repeat-associated protein
MSTRADHGTGAILAGRGVDGRTFCRHNPGHLVNRYYDPASYQFLSIDPKVGTTLEPYAFVAGDPLNATDPLGLGGGPICGRVHGRRHCYGGGGRARPGAFFHWLRNGAHRIESRWAKGFAEEHPELAYAARHTSMSAHVTLSGGAGGYGMVQLGIGEAGGHSYVSESIGVGGTDSGGTGSLTGGFSIANASNPTELAHHFRFVGASGGDGGTVFGGGGFSGTDSSGGTIAGFDIDGGIGFPGAEAHGGGSQTWIQQLNG